MGFIKDTNYSGDEVDKPDTISQEMRHRAKILSHKLQCSLRKKKEDDAKAKERKKVVDDLIKSSKLHTLNDSATSKISACANVPDDEQDINIEDLPIECFVNAKRLLVAEMKAFIHIRKFNTATIPKGKASEIPSGKGNLQKASYEARALPILLSRPLTDDDGNVLIDEELTNDGVDRDAVNEDEENETNSNDETHPILAIESTNSTIDTPRQKSNENNLPSYFLQDKDYITLVKANIHGTYNVEELTVTEDKLHNADKISRLLHRKLAKHIREKIDDPFKHNHPALFLLQCWCISTKQDTVV